MINPFTDEHFNVNDIPDDWAVMVVLGKSEYGPLYFPELKIKLPYRARDVFLRSRVLKHFSQAFKGLPRHVVVFTNHQGLFKYLEHWWGRILNL